MGRVAAVFAIMVVERLWVIWQQQIHLLVLQIAEFVVGLVAMEIGPLVLHNQHY
ncbi:MAG TPA: hypothetical protein VLR54_01070 [Methanobacteriaceae archaeon]|nr:hypothetical protein [Methanobacteriaceae archaeon]